MTIEQLAALAAQVDARLGGSRVACACLALIAATTPGQTVAAAAELVEIVAELAAIPRVPAGTVIGDDHTALLGAR